MKNKNFIILIILIFIVINFLLKKKTIYKNRNKFKKEYGNLKKTVNLISVIIPFYNEELVILKTLKKITNIGIRGELILINNSSNDRGTEIVDEFISNYNNLDFPIYHIFCSDIGKGNALLVGFKNANYDTILMTDADDEYDINEYPKLIQKYRELDDKFVEVIAENNSKYSGYNYFLYNFYSLFYKILLADNFTTSGTRIFSRKVILNLIENNKLYAKQFGENFDISRGLHQFGKTYSYNIKFKRRSIEYGRKMFGINKINFMKYSISFLMKELFNLRCNNKLKLNKIKNRKKNIHIGIILDGNRRFTKKINGLKKLQHLIGLLKIFEIMYYFRNNKDVKYLTLYCFAENNWKRSSEEINNIFKLIEKLKINYKKYNHDKDIKINIISTNTDNFSNELKLQIKQIHNISNQVKNPKLECNLLLSYSGQNEINIASKSNNFQKILLTNNFPKIDLIIRTGGNKRLSDFCLYNSAYSEIIFLDKFFPELNTKDIDKILEDYYKTQKNFGK